MQYLHVLAKSTTDGQFDVYWTNTTLETLRGIIRVKVPAGEDRNIIAELHALQYLLEDEEVIGFNAVGNANIKLVVSSGAIKKLTRKASDKAHLIEHAKFLTTRFYGCKIEVEKSEKWIGCAPERAERVALDASTPHEETIVVNGLGAVSVTSHVVERFAERLTEVRKTNFTLGEAWRVLRDIAVESQVAEVDRTSEKMRIRYAIKGSQEGRYFVHPVRKWVFVCTKYPQQKRLALVTAYTCQ